MKQNAPSQNFNLADNQSGHTTLALLASIGAMFFYLFVARERFLEQFPLQYDTVALAILGIISLFTIGCTVHMIFLGGPTERDLKKKVNALLSELTETRDAAVMRMGRLEKRYARFPELCSWRGQEAIRTTRRILNALNQRCQEVNALTEKKKEFFLIKAFQLLKQPLAVDTNCVDQVISGNPIPAIDAEYIQVTIIELLREIDKAIAEVEKQTTSIARTMAHIYLDDEQIQTAGCG